MSAIVKRGLRDLRRSPLFWGIPLGLLSAFELAIYPSLDKTLSKLVNGYPDALKQAFRIEAFNTPAQFLNGEMFSLIVPLAVAFFAIRAATRPIVGAEERGWLDTVLTAPVRRRTLMAGAFFAAGICTALILAVLAVMIWASGEIFGAVIPASDVLAGCASVWPLAMFFAGLGLLLSGLMDSWSTVTGIAAGTLALMYVIDVASRITSSLDAIGPLSVFHWFGAALIHGLDWAAFFGVSAAALALVAGGAVMFERRDIHG